MHDGICQTTAFINDSPPLSFAKFTTNPEIGLISSLDSKTTLFDFKKGKPLMEYTGYQNEDYLLNLDFVYTEHKKIQGFCIGSENGKLNYFDFRHADPKYILQVETEGNTLDFVIEAQNSLYTAGRTLNYVHKIDFKPIQNQNPG